MNNIPDTSADPSRWPWSWQRLLTSPQATEHFAKALGQRCQPGQVLGLIGELGAGKTTFTRALATGWGVAPEQDVTSPTYTLVNEYPAVRGPLMHLDLYRLQDLDSAYALGLEEVVADPKALIVVEWANHLPELLPPHTMWLRLSHHEETQRLCQGIGLSDPFGDRHT